jgi:putative SOS response-associated peptidase YedK
MLTTAPWEDIARYHNRQVVVLKSRDWSAWLHLTEPESELLRPLPERSLTVGSYARGPTNAC